MPATKARDEAALLTEEEARQAREQQAEEERLQAKAREDLKKAEEEGRLKAPKQEKTRFRSFVAPVERNTRFVVKAGEVFWLRDPNSPTGRRDMGRDGDKEAQFTNGVLTTDDPDIIAWCEAHSDICRDADDPQTAIWFNMKTAQTPSAQADPSLPSSLDIDAFMRGERQSLSGTEEGKVIDSARRAAEQANA